MTGVQPNDYQLEVILNPDDFICEGVPIDDPVTHQPDWIETEFKSSLNHTVYRESCNFTKDFQANNDLKTLVHFTGIESIVTLPCKRRGTLSPTKDCGFEIQHDNLACDVNQITHSMRFENTGDSDAIVRVCETSKVLGHSIACEYTNRLANVQIEAHAFANITFACPKPRSVSEPGGLYSVLVATLLPDALMPKVNLVVN